MFFFATALFVFLSKSLNQNAEDRELCGSQKISQLSYTLGQWRKSKMSHFQKISQHFTGFGFLYKY